MDVSALSAVPGSKGTKVWAATAGGAVLVSAEDDEPRVERTAAFEEGNIASLPTGPVDALVALEDESVFLAYNEIPSDVFLGSELAERRSRTYVRYVPAQGEPGPEISFTGGQIRDLAFSPVKKLLGLFVLQEETLWVATSAGLFKAVDPREPDTSFKLVTAGGLSAPFHTVKIDEKERIWLIRDRQDDVPPAVIGYKPGSDTTLALTSDRGIADADAIDDIDFTDDGEIVVLVGSRLAKGKVRVPGERSPWTLPASLTLTLLFGVVLAVFAHPQVVRLRSHPETLRDLPLRQVPAALRRLRRARALNNVREQLGLSESRLKTLQTLAPDAPDALQLRVLADLLGAPKADATELRPGLWRLAAELPHPAPLSGHRTPIFALDSNATRNVDPQELRDVVKEELTALALRFEKPFVVLCRDPQRAREAIPSGRAALLVGEKETKELLFSRGPRETFAGLLLTQDVLALSPYSTEGEVRAPEMFFGRVSLLREILNADAPQFLLIGPRRVGKTSVLRKLREELGEKRPELLIVHLDLLNVSEPRRVVRRLARKLGTAVPDIPADAGAAQTATVLSRLLTGRFESAEKSGLVLLDEADALVEADADAGFPLLSELRTLQAEGVCSFVLAGYWHLFRRTLDHSSPLYNFASVKRLGPLDPEDGYALATEPMTRLGLTWADDELPQRLVARVGGYPNLVQLLCDEVLKGLKESRSLVLGADELERAEKSSLVRSYLVETFGYNTLVASQVLVYLVLARETFSFAEAQTALEEAAGRGKVAVRVVEGLLSQLVLYGFVREAADVYSWTIPLLRETLLAGRDREHRVTRLLEELPADPSGWGDVESPRA